MWSGGFARFARSSGRWLLGLLVLTSCAAPPLPPLPRPIPFRSPLPPARATIYFPQLPMAGYHFGRGAAVTYAGLAGCQDAAQIGARWLYDWSAFPPTCPGVLSLPLVWDRNPDACPRLGPGAPILLWNEPSNAWAWGAGNTISPAEAITLTHNLTEICYPGRTFATPAEFNGQSVADGVPWLTAWWDGYVARYGTPPRVGIVALHCYAGTAQTCIDSLSRNLAWAQARGLRVLVTEWAIVPPWAGGTLRAMWEADILLHWLQAQPEIAGEAWFASRITGAETWSFKPPLTNLLDFTTGETTTWGRWYAEPAHLR
jgi:hypothetical protein